MSYVTHIYTKSMRYNYEFELTRREKDAINFICKYFCITKEDLMGSKRKRPIPYAKAAVSYYLTKWGKTSRNKNYYANLKYKTRMVYGVASSFFKMDHTTILHHVKEQSYILHNYHPFLMETLFKYYTEIPCEWEESSNFKVEPWIETEEAIFDNI